MKYFGIALIAYGLGDVFLRNFIRNMRYGKGRQISVMPPMTTRRERMQYRFERFKKVAPPYILILTGVFLLMTGIFL